MSNLSSRWKATLRDGAIVTLRAIAPEDKPLLADSFERLSDESRYRRFLTATSRLSAADLDFLVDIDHSDHEAIIAIDRATGEALGVARYIRSKDDRAVAEVAVTVTDDWQGRGLGRALLDRLTYRARREGIRQFSALLLADNRQALGLIAGLGITRHSIEAGAVELLIDLPPKRGTGTRLARALRTAAVGSLVPATTLVHRVAFSVSAPPRPPVGPVRPIRTIVVGADGSEAGAQAVAVGLGLSAALGAAVHLVAAYGAEAQLSDAEAALSAATRAARAKGLEPATHARCTDAVEALIGVANEQHADLVVVGVGGTRGASRSRLGVLEMVSAHAPCSILLVRGGERERGQGHVGHDRVT